MYADLNCAVRFDVHRSSRGHCRLAHPTPPPTPHTRTPHPTPTHPPPPPPHHTRSRAGRTCAVLHAMGSVRARADYLLPLPHRLRCCAHGSSAYILRQVLGDSTPLPTFIIVACCGFTHTTRAVTRHAVRCTNAGLDTYHTAPIRSYGHQFLFTVTAARWVVCVYHPMQLLVPTPHPVCGRYRCRIPHTPPWFGWARHLAVVLPCYSHGCLCTLPSTPPPPPHSAHGANGMPRLVPTPGYHTWRFPVGQRTKRPLEPCHTAVRCALRTLDAVCGPERACPRDTFPMRFACRCSPVGITPVPSKLPITFGSRFCLWTFYSSLVRPLVRRRAQKRHTPTLSRYPTPR